MTNRQSVWRERLNHVFQNTPKGQYIRFHQDGELIVCRKFADKAGYVCVDGKPSLHIVYVWD